ncbi:hypothetical protein Hte_010728 [Hypoxylon texense]
MARHIAHMASTLAQVVTIYTNGDEDLAAELRKTLASLDQYRVEHGAIAKLSFDTMLKETVKISFKDGSEKGEAFLVHSPYTRVKGPFAEQLGLEFTPTGDYLVYPPFNETSVEAVPWLVLEYQPGCKKRS